LCGDFNIAPEARDVYDASQAEGGILFHPDERAAFARLLAWGLCDTLRLHRQEGGFSSCGESRSLAFQSHPGFRSDHVLGTPPLAARCPTVTLERELRKLPK